MKVILLAGGLGTRLSEETKKNPKPLVKIGPYPILVHIMNIYNFYGYKDFVICGGYKIEKIIKYFKNFSDFKLIEKKKNQHIFFSKKKNWSVNIFFTGKDTNTGGRILKIKKIFNNNELFFLTYGDGLANININKLLKFHQKQKLLVTVTAVKPPARFGVIKIFKNKVKNFQEKVDNKNTWINGGFFVFNSNALKYFKKTSDSLEQNVLLKIVKDKKISAYKHKDFWLPMDTLRDKNKLKELWQENKAPWDKLKWN